MYLSTNRLVTAFLCCLFSITAAVAQAQEDPPAGPPEVDCRSCILVDDKGAILFSRLAAKSFPNASTTKMVTALVTVDHADGGEEVEVSPVAEAVPGGKLSLYAGEKWSVDELLHALLMNSSNDAAVVLAEHIAGSEAAFVEMMNAKVIELGADRTFFVTSHGLDEPGHQASALDLVKIAEELLATPRLARIVGKRTAVIESPSREARLENTNLLIEGYPGAIGVKTGYTALAGNVLVAAAERSGRRLIAVSMGSDDPFSDSARLLDHGFRRLRNTVLLSTTELIDSLVFASSSSTGVTAGREVRGIHDPDDVTLRFEPAEVNPPLDAGDEVGAIHVLAGRRLIRTVPAIAVSEIEMEPEPGWATNLLTGILRRVGNLVSGEDGPSE